MKTPSVLRAFLGTALLMAARPASVPAQAPPPGDPTPSVVANASGAGRQSRFEESDWSGPRMGFMFAPGDAAIARRLKDHGLGSVVSQFGWHFEKRVVPFNGGPQLVTEAVPLIGGVEYGKVVPSLTLAMGVRLPSGFEFGMGPSLTAVSATNANMGLVVAAGKSIDYGDVRIPLNLAVSTNPRGTMVSLIVGYAMHRMTR